MTVGNARNFPAVLIEEVVRFIVIEGDDLRLGLLAPDIGGVDVERVLEGLKLRFRETRRSATLASLLLRPVSFLLGCSLLSVGVLIGFGGHDASACTGSAMWNRGGGEERRPPVSVANSSRKNC